MSYTDNPIADFDRWDAEQTKQLERLPVCCECDHHIQDEHFYQINGEPLCEQCLNENHRKRTEDYVC